MQKTTYLQSNQLTIITKTFQTYKQKSPLLQSLRQWLNDIEVKNEKLARTICQIIPTQCPFERTISLFGRTILSIPPLCKLNPLYEEVVALKFRAMCFLADECGEDVSKYC